MAMEKKSKEKKKQRVSFGMRKQTLQKRKTKTKVVKKKKKQFLKRVVDYLFFDSYMYAPLISSTPSSGSHLSSSNVITSLTTGPFNYLKRIIEAISTKKVTTTNQQTSKNKKTGLFEDQSNKACNPETNGLEEVHTINACNSETDFVDQEGLERAEMVKHIVRRTSIFCASSYSVDKIEQCATTSPTVDDFINTNIK